MGKVLRFLLRKFDEAMQRIGYLPPEADTKPVYAHGTRTLLYNLAFYSKSASGQTLWRKTLASLATRVSGELRLRRLVLLPEAAR